MAGARHARTASVSRSGRARGVHRSAARTLDGNGVSTAEALVERLVRVAPSLRHPFPAHRVANLAERRHAPGGPRRGRSRGARRNPTGWDRASARDRASAAPRRTLRRTAAAPPPWRWRRTRTAARTDHPPPRPVSVSPGRLSAARSRSASRPSAAPRRPWLRKTWRNECRGSTRKASAFCARNASSWASVGSTCAATSSDTNSSFCRRRRRMIVSSRSSPRASASR